MRLRALMCAGALVTVAGSAPAQDLAGAGDKGEARVRLIRTYQDTVKVDGRDEARTVRIYYDYTAGVARETISDQSGAVLEEKVLQAQPRPTDEEFEEAVAIVRADRVIGAMLARVKAVPDGGFLLEEGDGKPCGPHSRCVQVVWLSPDRVGLVRWTVIDLVRQGFAYRAYQPPQNEEVVQ
jgi:hypothetical protein